MKLTCLWISYLRYCTRIMYMAFFFLFSLDLILHPIYYFLQRASTILVHQTFHPSHLSNSSKSHSTHFKIIILFLFFSCSWFLLCPRLYRVALIIFPPRISIFFAPYCSFLFFSSYFYTSPGAWNSLCNFFLFFYFFFLWQLVYYVEAHYVSPPPWLYFFPLMLGSSGWLLEMQ